MITEYTKMCNCADCGREILGESCADEANDEMPLYVSGRINGRPYCQDCWNVPRAHTGSSSGPNHTDPSWDNVVRAMEEDR